MSITLLWVGLALMGAITMAAMALVSEVHHHPTVPRLFWLRAVSMAVSGIVCLFIDWPDNPVFYYCVAGLSLLICMSDVLYYKAARDYGAGATTRIEPLSVLMTFVGWTAITPALLHDYLSQPLESIGIVACFLAAGYCALRLRHCPVSFAVMRHLFPVIVIMAVVSILGKTGMDAGGNPFNAAVVYVFLQATTLVVFYAVLSRAVPARTGPLRPTRPLLYSAALMSVFSMLHISTKNAAYTFVPNPAYVTVIGLSAPLFVLAYYRLTGRRDESDIWAGLGIVASAVALIALTRF